MIMLWAMKENEKVKVGPVVTDKKGKRIQPHEEKKLH